MKNILTVFEPKYPFYGLYKTDMIPLSHYGILNYRGFKELFIGQSRMFGLSIFSTQKEIEK